MGRRNGYRGVFMRGGTSKAIIFREKDIPSDPAERHAMFLKVMGSPDPAKRQLDGLGGGMSSLSKVCIVESSSRDDADVDYTFAQIPVAGTTVDYSANCGNMSSAIGPFAVEEGIVASRDGEAEVRIFNTNTRKIIVSRFAVEDGRPKVEGDFVNPGVAGTGSPIRLDFIEPGGAATGRLLPTGSVIDTFEHPELPGPVRASVIDATNLIVFVLAEDLGWDAIETPDQMEADATLMHRLEVIRRIASARAGLAPDFDAAANIEGNPKIGIVGPSRDYIQTTGVAVAAEEYDVSVRMLSMGQAHRAIPLTAALCTAVAARVDGTAVAAMARVSASVDMPLRIGHSSGVLPAVARVGAEFDTTWIAHSAGVFRTAKRLMEGIIYA